MGFRISFTLLLISTFCYSQTSKELDSIRSFLVKQAGEYYKKYEETNDSIKLVEKAIRLEKAREIGINRPNQVINESVRLEGLAPLREQPINSSPIITNGGYKEVFVTELIDEEWAQIRLNNKTYYIANRNLPTDNNKINKAKRNLELIKEALQEQHIKDIKENERIKDSLRHIEYEQAQLSYEKRQKDLAIENQKRQAEKAEEIKQLKEERRKNLIEKYGSSIGIKINNQEIWIGMSEQMLLDSWGQPNDKNVTISQYGRKEQWVYGSGRYVYLDNGKVNSIQY